MINNFDFATTKAAIKLCGATIEEMVNLFDISKEEATGRLEREWNQGRFRNLSCFLHEDEHYWANSIYYGEDCYWWMKDEILVPISYP